MYFALNMNTEAEELWNRIINIFNSLNDSQKENLNMEVKNAIIEIQQYFNDKHEKIFTLKISKITFKYKVLNV